MRYKCQRGAILLPLKHLSSNHIISTLFYCLTIEQFLIQVHFFRNLVHTVCHKTIFVSDSFAIIKGSAERHVKEGSQLSLFCAIEDSSGPPNYVFWYRDDHVVNYSDEMGIQILTDPDQIQVCTVFTLFSHFAYYN